MHTKHCFLHRHSEPNILQHVCKKRSKICAKSFQNGTRRASKIDSERSLKKKHQKIDEKRNISHFGGPKTRPQVVPRTVILQHKRFSWHQMAAKTVQEHPQSCKRHLRAPQDLQKHRNLKILEWNFLIKKASIPCSF